MGLIKQNSRRKFTLYQRAPFLRKMILSKAVFFGQVVACPARTSIKIQAALSSFLWTGKILRPNPGVSLRGNKEGGLGMVETSLFLKAIFTRPLLTTLTGVEGIHRRILRYWLSYPTRKTLELLASTPPPISYFRRPLYIENLIPVIKELKEEDLLTKDGPRSHKTIYYAWVAKCFSQGPIEGQDPTLDWKRIWKDISLLPHDKKESMFLLNHRLLYTRERRNKINPIFNALCTVCESQTETDSHLLVECDSRREISTWLTTKLRQLGENGQLRAILRGQITSTTNHQKALRLVASYVKTVWKTRDRIKPTTTDEITIIWNKC